MKRNFVMNYQQATESSIIYNVLALLTLDKNTIPKFYQDIYVEQVNTANMTYFLLP